MSAVQKMKGFDPLEILFTPTRIGSLELHNRIAMAPMTRAMSPGGVPGEDVARYYRRRAEGGVGLIITEGTFIPHPSAGNDCCWRGAHFVGFADAKNIERPSKIVDEGGQTELGADSRVSRRVIQHGKIKSLSAHAHRPNEQRLSSSFSPSVRVTSAAWAAAASLRQTQSI
jgi:NADH:flavin oxidoreductase / NADH oxidase family